MDSRDGRKEGRKDKTACLDGFSRIGSFTL